MSPTVVVNGGVLADAATLRAAWNGHLHVGLYQSDTTPWPSMDITDLEPATFSGYGGPMLLVALTPPVLVGPRALIQGAALLWSCTGAGVSNYIYGIYYVDDAGRLYAAERVWDTPVIMASPLDAAGITPRLTVRSEYPK